MTVNESYLRRLSKETYRLLANRIRKLFFRILRPYFLGLLKRTDSTESLYASTIASLQKDMQAMASRLSTIEAKLRRRAQLRCSENVDSSNLDSRDLVDVRFTEIDSRPSYSQIGEDCVLAYFFERIGRGLEGLRYVDIGSGHPVGHNNTFLFYSLGGSGLLVEADPEYLPAYRVVRPRDRVEQVAVVPRRMREQGHVKFHSMSDRGWSTVSEDHVAAAMQLGKSGDNFGSFDVPCVTINELLDKHFSDEEVDLLSIDIEGFDIAVLNEIDFERYRPKAIVFENTLDSTTGRFRLPNGSKLDEVGYQLFASTFANSIYVDKDCLSRLRV